MGDLIALNHFIAGGIATIIALLCVLWPNEKEIKTDWQK